MTDGDKIYSKSQVCFFILKSLKGNDIDHEQAVADKCESDEAKAVAFLHDLVEDGYIKDIEYLWALGDNIIDAVARLTRHKDMTYADYINEIAESDDLIAIEVKLADLAHNLSRCKKSLKARYMDAISVISVAREAL